MSRVTLVIILTPLYLAGCGVADSEREVQSASDSAPVAPATSPLIPAHVEAPLATDPAAPPRYLDAEDLARLVEIPIQYHGRWISPEEGCERSEETNVKIDDFHMLFYESRAVALAVRPMDESTVVFDLEFSGEGQKWHRSQTLRLSEDKQTMDDPTTMDSEHPFVRIRCTPIQEASAAPDDAGSGRAQGSLEGFYAISSMADIGVPPGELPNSHLLLKLKGDTARNLYDAMKTQEQAGRCTSQYGLTKTMGGMRCVHEPELQTYECSFVIRLATQTVEAPMC